MEVVHNRINFEVSKHVAHVSLARSDKMNAIDVEMIEAIQLVGQKIVADNSIRAVVLSGEGDNFCAGLDQSNFKALLQNRHIAFDPEKPQFVLETRTHGSCNVYQYIVRMWRELRMPVIVAVEGVVFGGGLQIMLGGDCRFASPQSRFSIMELKWGIIPDMGGISIMRQLVRDDVLRLLTYTAQEFTAQEAKEWGFITDIADDPLARALDLAYDIADRNPDAIRSAKKVFEASIDLSTEQTLLLEAQQQDKILGRANQVEAVVSKIKGRSAVFND